MAEEPGGFIDSLFDALEAFAAGEGVRVATEQNY